MKLSQEQTEKLARLWQFCRNQSALWIREHEPDSEPLAVRYIRPTMGGMRAEVVDNAGRSWRPLPRELRPDLADPVTRDGLPRTARMAWGCPQLSAVCPDNLWLVANGGRHDISANVFSRGTTESEAWLAAIITAPEAK